MGSDHQKLEWDSLQSLTHMFEERVRLSRDEVAYISVASGAWKETLWREFYDMAKALGCGLISLGVKPGDRVCMIAENRPESYIMIMATLMIGAVPSPVYHNETADGLAYIIKSVEAEIIFAEDQEQVDKIIEVQEQMPTFKQAVVYEKYEPKDLPWAMRFDEVSQRGQERMQEFESELAARIDRQRPEDLAVIIHTSGTTGPPKGVIYTNRSLLFFCHSYSIGYPQTPTDIIMIYLPLAHAGGLNAGIFFQIFTDISGFFAESWEELAYNLQEVSPTFYVSMPRVLEKFYSRIHTMIDDAPWLQNRLSHWSLMIGRSVSRLKLTGEAVPFYLRIGNLLAGIILFRKIKELFGGKIRFAASGGAPISPVIIRFFHSVGLLILEGYGLTETGVITFNFEDDFRFGSVGKPYPGVEIKIEEDGEILYRGIGACSGYWRNEEETKRLFKDGWICTGDIGKLDEESFLWITDRKKDLLVTAGGKNVAPANIENLMKTSKYLSECIVFGDRKPYLVCLLSLDEDEITKFARDNRIIFENFEALTKKPEVMELIKKTVNELNQQLPRVAQPKKFRILGEELDIDENEVTPTLKVKRRVVGERYNHLIKDMYS
ncbi:AMP-dependent synthetase/ligase [Thermodesulfobacteriota bacterium]